VAGQSHGCGLRGSGSLYCWGLDSNGQLGLGETDAAVTPTQVGSSTDWSSLSAGTLFNCAVRGGQAYCWGDNQFGQIGAGNSNAIIDQPTVVVFPAN
jgi:alpha-tubulin suppressor-like RCC1 family protein